MGRLLYLFIVLFIALNILVGCDSVKSQLANDSDEANIERLSERNGFRDIKLETPFGDYKDFIMSSYDKPTGLMVGYFEREHEPLFEDKVVHVEGIYNEHKLGVINVYIESDDAKKYISSLTSLYGKATEKNNQKGLYWRSNKVYLEITNADFQIKGENLICLTYTSLKLEEKFNKKREESLKEEL